MMSLFTALREAETTVEFFILLLDLQNLRYTLDIQTEVRPDRNGTGAYVQFLIQEHGYRDEKRGTNVLAHRIAHVFTLHQNGEIYWEMRGKPLRVGLEKIQAELAEFAPVLKDEQLRQYITIDNQSLPEPPRSIAYLENFR